MTIVGQCIGGWQKDEAVYYIKSFVCCGSDSDHQLSECICADKTDHDPWWYGKESADMCIHMTMWITIVKPLVWVMAFIPAYGLRAAGDVKFSMTVSVLSMWLCRVTLAMILARVFHMGPMAVWIGMFTDWTIRCVIFTIRFKNRNG